jgi:aminoglycoside 3-N-acetyltransferase I
VVRRLLPGERALAREAVTLLAEVFDEPGTPLDDGWIDQLLERRDCWIVVALEGATVVGALTAHTLPMTRAMTSELLLYDLAVRTDRQRRGIGRTLVTVTRELAAAQGIPVTFVPADEEDTHALDFYRALDGDEAPVRIFTWSAPDTGAP